MTWQSVSTEPEWQWSKYMDFENTFFYIVFLQPLYISLDAFIEEQWFSDGCMVLCWVEIELSVNI